MNQFSRREFLKIGAGFAAALGLDLTLVPQVVDALSELASGGAPVLWLQGQACSGCSVSLLNSKAPGPAQILFHTIRLRYHSTLSTATGDLALKAMKDTIQEGKYILVLEGAIPIGIPEACMVGGEPHADLVRRAARSATSIVTAGTCAAWGGIPAAEGNPTGAVSVGTFLANEGIKLPLINIPGCPMHPDWFVGTLVHLLKFGMPALDHLNRPEAYFGKLIHDGCPRYSDYERKNYANSFGDDGCLFQLGCLGPVTHADCPQRKWNSGVNWCIDAGGPCVGCAGQNFAARKDLPLYRKSELARLVREQENK